MPQLAEHLPFNLSQAQTGGEQPISTLPTWSSLYLTVNGVSYEVGTDISQISNYSQSLSIQTGVVSTALTWTPSANVSLTLNYTIVAHRVIPNLGIVRLDVTGLNAGSNVTVTSVLDVRLVRSLFHFESSSSSLLHAI